MPKHMRDDEAQAVAVALDFYQAQKANAESAIKHLSIALEEDSMPEGKRHRIMQGLFAYMVVDMEAFAEVLSDYADVAADGLLEDESLTDLDGLVEGIEGLQEQTSTIHDALKAAPLLPLDDPEPAAGISDPEPPASGFRLDWNGDEKGSFVHESGRWFAIEKGTYLSPETYGIEPRFTPAERQEAEESGGRGTHPTWVAMPRNGDRPGLEVAYLGDYQKLYGDDSQLFVPDLVSACAAIFQTHYSTGEFVAHPPR